MPEEAVFFGRSGVFGLVLAGVYWFVSYEIVGTVLLAGFGVATGAAFVILGRAARRATRAPQDGEGSGEPSAPFEDEGGRVPLRSFAPLWVGVGVGFASLGLAFGVWFVLAGLVPLVLGAASWLAEVGREAEG
ncbi:MAG TPA: cytochrome c oxidase subunit 4 [Candidatus Limnocylindrales bacterium]|jgi:hypothetical protein